MITYRHVLAVFLRGMAIVPHAVGKQTNCNISWCDPLEDPTVYKCSYPPPHGQDLYELDNLLKDLEGIVEVLICKKCRHASLSWLKTNEALVNTTVGSKVPKSHPHGSSEGSDV